MSRHLFRSGWKRLPLKSQKILHELHTPQISKEEWALDSLDTLIFTLKDASVRKVFAEKAIGFGHPPAEAKQMHTDLIGFLAGEYQRATND